MYPTHYAKAAALMEIIRDHAFVDGNKRTGQLAGAALLRVLSGRRLYVPRACYELGRKSHRNADSTVGLVPSRSLFPAFLSRF